jgi:hypothetical protein
MIMNMEEMQQTTSPSPPSPGGGKSILQLIPLELAAERLGIRSNSLRKVLSRHPEVFQTYYKVDPGCKRRVRYLTVQEIEEIRQRKR